MKRAIPRRSLLIGGAAAVVVIGGGAAAVRNFLPASRSPDAEEADYAKLLAEVHDDYVNGRVVEHQGWVLSQHEFDTLGLRQKDQAKAAGSGAIS